MTAPAGPLDDQDGRLHRLAAAMEAFLRFRAGELGADRERFLAEHAPLRDLLEPMLADADEDEAEATPVPQPGRCLGDYRLLREVGRGGMGVVYEAEQISLRRRVALKVLPAHLIDSPRAIERFRHEAALASRLRHPAIVPIHEVGEWRGVHYYSMEFVCGRTLQAAAQDERLGVRDDCSRVAEAAELVARLAAALQHAHEHGLVHRDVKPHNVMIGTDGSVRLMDFGVAKDLGAASQSVTGEFLGTPHYCSPEQVTGAPIGPTSDVFSLGIVLYELLAHRRPFAGDDARAVLRRIEIGEFPSLRSVAPAVPRDLQTICHKALERHPGHRYPSAGAFADDLRRFLRIEPIHAAPPSLLTRSSKWVRRHQLRLAVAALAALAVVGAPTAYAWHLQQTNTTIEAERQVLDQAEELAFRSIEQTLALLGEQLDQRPEPGGLQDPRLDTVVDLCESFLALRRDLPARRLRVAAALERVAGIYTNLDRLGPANDACSHAEALLADAPDASSARGLELRARLLHRRMLIAQLTEAGREDEAFAAADAAWQRSIAAAPDAAAPRFGRLQTVLMRCRSLADDPRRRGDSERLLGRFHAMLDEASSVDGPEKAWLAVQGDVTRGQLLVHARRSEEALQCLTGVLPRLDAMPQDARVGIVEAHVRAMLGTTLQRLDRPREAEQSLRSAIHIATRWFAASPGSPKLRRMLVHARMVLATQLLAEDQQDEAERLLREAVACCPPIQDSADATTVPGFADHMLAAELLRQLSDCLLLRHEDGSKDAEARALLERAVAFGDRLLAAHPDALEPMAGTAMAHNSLAMFANERGESGTAADHSAKAVALQHRVVALSPESPNAMALLGMMNSNLAHALARLGRDAEAVRAAGEVLAQAPDRVTALRIASEAATRAAERLHSADAERLAVTLLERIAELDPREGLRLLDDPRFASLGSRADVHTLRQRLERSR